MGSSKHANSNFYTCINICFLTYMLLNSIIIAITYHLFIYNLMKENPRLQMPNGSELSFSLVGSFRWMVVFSGGSP